MAQLLSNRAAEKVKALLDRETGRLQATIPPPPHRDYPSDNWQQVRPTGEPVDGDGSGAGSAYEGGARYWPGEIVMWNTFTEEEIVLGPVWLYVWGDGELQEGDVYDGRQTGNKEIDDDVRPCFTIANGFVTNLDGSGSGDDNEAVIHDCNPDTGERRIITIRGSISVETMPG